MPTMAAVAATMPAPWIQSARYISALREYPSSLSVNRQGLWTTRRHSH